MDERPEYLTKPGYWYRHVNGSVHYKPFAVVDMGGGPQEYFDSPFVATWWKVERLPENGEAQ